METLSLFGAAFGASALGGVLGMASGIFIVPLLTLLFGINLHAAIGASIVSVIACSCGSAAPFLKGGLTNIRLAIVLETATTLGALTGVFLIGLVSTSILYGLFAAILALSAKQMLARRGEMIEISAPSPKSWATLLRLHSSFPDPVSGQAVPYQVGRVPLGLVLMYGAGLISALLGIGSGVLKIPAMDTTFRLPIKVSSATSNFMIGVTAAASAGAYFVRGDIDSGIAGPIALGSVVGALAGARLLMRLPADKLRIFFVVILLILAMQMLMSALGLHSPLIAAGVFLAAVEALPSSTAVTGHNVVKAGVAVFILLPVARVALMLAIFLRERDYTYTLIAALVLAIIAAGIVVGAD